jgi:hypothetical protein
MLRKIISYTAQSGYINQQLGQQTRYVYTSLKDVKVHYAIRFIYYAEKEIHVNLIKGIQGPRDLTNQMPNATPTYVRTYVPTYLATYGSTALVELGRFFSFLIYT